MITERHEELAVQHTLGFLEETEGSAFAAEMADDPNLAGLVESLHYTAAQIALVAPQVRPSAGLKARLLAAATPPVLAPVVTFPLQRFAPWGVAAALTIGATWLATRNLALQSENDALRTEYQLAEIAYQTAQTQLEQRSLVAENMINDLGRQLLEQQDLSRLKITALASLAGNTAEARAIAVWDPVRETGLLTVDKLPVIADNQDYQIWVIDPAYPIPVDGGVFKPGADGHAVLSFKGDKPIKTVAAFAISLEKKGGVPKAEGPIVLLGKVPPI